jgi:hypothetical protein
MICVLRISQQNLLLRADRQRSELPEHPAIPTLAAILAYISLKEVS